MPKPKKPKRYSSRYGSGGPRSTGDAVKEVYQRAQAAAIKAMLADPMPAIMFKDQAKNMGTIRIDPRLTSDLRRHSIREQADSAFKVMAEYRRRLIAAGFVFGEGPLSDCVGAGPGVDPMLAMTIWRELTGDDGEE